MAQNLADHQRHQAVVEAAQRAQRTIDRVNTGMAVIFVLALGYLFVNTAIAMLFQTTSAPIEPQSFGTTVQPLEKAATVALSPSQGFGVGDAAELAKRNFSVLPAQQLQRETSATSAEDRALQQAKATPEDTERLRNLQAQADQALNEAFDYAKAVALADQAVGVLRGEYFERDRAKRSLDRASVYFNVAQGVTPVTLTSRIVAYTPPRAKEAMVTAVPKTVVSWQSGKVSVVRLDTDTPMDLSLTLDWKAVELTPAQAQEALLKRLKNRAAKLKELKAAGLATPVDFCNMAVAILESGDLSAAGGPANYKALAHACLGEGFEMAEAFSTSLAQTIQIRRDPDYQVFITVLARVEIFNRQLKSASLSQAEIISGEVSKALKEAQRLLDSLLMRYPRAWDFKDKEAATQIQVMQKKMSKEAEEAAKREADKMGADDMTRLDKPAENMTAREKAEFYVKKGQDAYARGNTLEGKTKMAGFNERDLYDTLSQAVDLYTEARGYYNQAKTTDPASAEELGVEELIVEANQAIYFANKSKPLRKPK